MSTSTYRAGLLLPLVLSVACQRQSTEGSAPVAPDDAGGTPEGSHEGANEEPVSPEMQALRQLVLSAGQGAPDDPTNRYADDAGAAALGKKFFFDTRFSGPLLDDANNGFSGTLGMVGDTGKVGCASCHVPGNLAFVDTRSARQQLSLASGWTHRRTPTLLDVSQATFLLWDGRRDTAYSQPLGPVESPLEFNSSRLFLAQQIERFYKVEYEAVFGSMPALDAFPRLLPQDAGCKELPPDPAHEICPMPGHDDEQVTRVAVNFGKAIQAFTRQLSCGRSRFDDWIDGDESALTADEKAGAVLFVTKGACNQCHSGPYLSDQRFYNLGVPGGFVPFTGVNTANDPGASTALSDLRSDWLNSKGPFSDGDDGRLDSVPEDLSSLVGAFRTPSLRCVGRRPSFMHNGEFRSLEDVVAFFSTGGAESSSFVGTSVNYPRNFSEEEQAQLVAFLRALDGPGPREELMEPPTLPE